MARKFKVVVKNCHSTVFFIDKKQLTLCWTINSKVKAYD
jgi:hypothetical protein